MKGRRWIFILVVIVFLCLWVPMGTLEVSAEAQEPQQTLNEGILEQLEMLDVSELEDYLKTLGLNDGQTLKDRLMEFIGGGGIEYEKFFQGILDVLFQKIKHLLPSFAAIAAIALMCGILNSLQSKFLGESTAKIVFFVAYLGALIPLLGVFIECIEASKQAVFSMRRQMELVFPIMLTLMAAIGGSVSVAIYKPSVLFLSNVLVGAIEQVVFPISIAIIVFSMVNNFFGELKTEKFSAFFKSINKWIMGVGAAVFGLFFTIQGIGAATYDGILKRAAKYAIGTGVPIVGGLLSGGFDLAVAGSVLIKNSLGNFSLLILFFVLFEPLTLLIAVNLLLRMTSAITQPFGESKVSSFLEESANNLNYFVAGLLFTAFLYFVVILLMVCTSEVLI